MKFSWKKVNIIVMPTLVFVYTYVIYLPHLHVHVYMYMSDVMYIVVDVALMDGL